LEGGGGIWSVGRQVCWTPNGVPSEPSQDTVPLPPSLQAAANSLGVVPARTTFVVVKGPFPPSLVCIPTPQGPSKPEGLVVWRDTGGDAPLEISCRNQATQVPQGQGKAIFIPGTPSDFRVDGSSLAAGTITVLALIWGNTGVGVKSHLIPPPPPLFLLMDPRSVLRRRTAFKPLRVSLIWF
jgi:hypothetical protein